MQNLIFVVKNGARMAIKQKKTNKRRQVEHVKEKKTHKPTHTQRKTVNYLK